jgi:hypothetical protein
MRRLFLLAAVIATVGCGSCDDDTSNNGNVDPNNTTADAGPTDSGTNLDADSDPADAGADTGTDTGQMGDAAQADMTTMPPTCGIYSDFCDGECIPTNTDPDNCGGCDIVCGAQEVCFGGRCIDSCQSGLEECDRRCVDPRSNSDNCGACGNACPAGQGCVDSNCVDAVDIDFDAATCAPGGVGIDLGDAAPEGSECAGDLAELTFRFGVCSCNDFDTNNPLTVDAFDSALGPYQPGGLGGGVGVNGEFVSNNGANISGTLWVAGASGITMNGDLNVGLSLLSGGRYQSTQDTTVGRDATVAGQLSTTKIFDVSDTLTLPMNEAPPSSATFTTLVNADVSVAEPCTECPPNAIDIPGIVAFHSDPANNDNALVGLDEDVFNPSVNAPNRLDLPCGRYYLTGLQATSPLTIVARGNTALFIDGNVTANNALTITLTPDAQLDLFISGDVTVNNDFTLGSPDYPALLRAYIGGANGFVANNAVDLGGYLYVVPGSITTNNDLEVFGGVYSGDITANNEWNIHYDRRVATIGETCDPDPDPDPGPDPDMGMPGDMGTPGPDPQCSLQDDVCMVDEDCCAPLSCVMGTCQLLDCVPSFGSCTDSSQCCNGVCTSATDGICVTN